MTKKNILQLSKQIQKALKNSRKDKDLCLIKIHWIAKKNCKFINQNTNLKYEINSYNYSIKP